MKCTKCGKDIYLQCSDDEPHKIDDNPVCDDCFFDELGKTLERCPLGWPFIYHH